MQWDLAGSSLGDSPKESGSSLGTRREITRKKTGGLAARLPEVTGVCGRFDLHLKKIGSGCRCASRRRTRKWTYAKPKLVRLDVALQEEFIPINKEAKL
ncbi:hypothetical protein BHE74_00040963 [Ensete ventricosum]|nr:hypothetical protein GW17_00061124 [Ensete ventricosum]RWW52601.1 hypothetical protein BHE74_00040963 [Ensete ventricosum]